MCRFQIFRALMAFSRQNVAIDHVNVFINDINNTLIKDQLTIWGILVDIRTPDKTAKWPQRFVLDDGKEEQLVINWDTNEEIGTD